LKKISFTILILTVFLSFQGTFAANADQGGILIQGDKRTPLPSYDIEVWKNKLSAPGLVLDPDGRGVSYASGVYILWLFLIPGSQGAPGIEIRDMTHLNKGVIKILNDQEFERAKPLQNEFFKAAREELATNPDSPQSQLIKKTRLLGK
jgi:hypothetical protein